MMLNKCIEDVIRPMIDLDRMLLAITYVPFEREIAQSTMLRAARAPA
jgi:hypothetical protein